MERLGVLGINSVLGERKRGMKEGREEGDMRGMWGEKGENFMILFWEKEREEEERRRREGG